MSFMDKAKNIIEFIINGISDFFDFLMQLPSFLNSIVNVIPSPFKGIILSFLGIIIVYFIAKAVMSIVS